MVSYLQKIISEVPAYVGQFVSCLMHPTHFINKQLQTENQITVLEKSVSFLILSFLISLFLSVALPEVTDPIQLPANDAEFIRKGSGALLQLFYLLGACCIAIGLLRLFGINASTNGFMALVFYFCGASLVLLVFANAISSVAMADPFFAKSWVALENLAKVMQTQLAELLCTMDTQTGELPAGSNPMELLPDFNQYQTIYSQATQRTLYKIAIGIQIAIALAVIMWLFIAWVIYTKIIGANLAKSLIAAVLTLAIVIVFALIVELVRTGAMMADIYRNCPQ
jgi:hypothetical protein